MEVETSGAEVSLQVQPFQPFEARFDAGSAAIVPKSANAKARTVDVVWYGGASVPRMNQKTGESYNLRLDMKGAKLDRLNAGAPVFDNHMTGSDFASAMAGTVGTKAQIGVVKEAWAQGKTGRATLQFASGDPAADQVWNKISQGIIQNLSFGTWIHDMQPDESTGPQGFAADDEEHEGPQSYVATSWEPFEVSPVCVPADFSTAFLSAEVTAQPISLPSQAAEVTTTQDPAPKEPETMRASARKENTPEMENLQVPGAEARPEINAEALKAEAIKEERARVKSIQLAAKPFASQLSEEFVDGLITEGLAVDESRLKMLEKLATKATKEEPPTTGQQAITKVTRDEADTRRENMEAALFYRANPSKHPEFAEKSREFVGMSLIEMAKESLQAIGVKTRGMSKEQVAIAALNGRANAVSEYFAGAYNSTSDFPKILENVANKSMRQAYQAYPQTFKAWTRQTTAADFKPLNRVQMSDVAALPTLNENGEYHRTAPSDSKETYSLATYGEIIAISRKVLINDDLQAFTRLPELLGKAAARLESDTVWGIITANGNMGDGNALFSSAHSNNETGAGTALAAAGLATAKAAFRLQTAPKGMILNLVPLYLLVPAALENTAEQLVSPLNIASSDVTKVIPGWIRSLNPIVEPRLDANSTAAWYLVADPGVIDTIEYCYLEGQQGVYTETRQGFDVDGFEIKARLDFAAAPVEYRGLQKNVGS
jgi:hypothetical protein